MKMNKKLVALLMVLTLVLTSVFVAIPYSAAETESKETGASYNLAAKVQDGTILHAFCCSFNNIKNRLPDIANAGFSAIQTSPVQQPKDFGGWNDINQWWKLYQPISFTVAQNDSWLGSKSDLTSLCNEAHKYGIKIICDIVANHTANDGSNGGVDWNLSRYESNLYNGKDRYFHPYVDCNDGSIRNVVWGNIGEPDLNTSDSYVQGRVTSLLKECVDCGVDGFRFDAAKHIETPDDGEYASNFWTNVLGNASSYAKSKKSKELYYYGEILNTVGNGRSYKSYSKFMSVTDNVTSDKTTASIKDNRASSVANTNYNSGLEGKYLVLWGESHDTYMGDSGTGGYRNTSNISQNVIDKGYCFAASRKGASALYFLRPNGGMGDFNSSTYKSSQISAINKFHNKFVGAEEKLYSSNSLAVCERYTSTGAGMVIVNCSGDSTSVNSLDTYHMANGSYKDAVSGNTFTVSNGKISGSIGSSGVAVVYNENSVVTPTSADTTSQVTPTNPPVQPTTTAPTPSKGLDFSNPLTVYLYNSANWNNPYLYSWSDNNGDDTSWPGREMTKYTTVNGVDVYSFTVKSREFSHIIFSNKGTPQTRDLEIQSGHVYWDNQKDNWEDASNLVIPNSTPTTAPTTAPITVPTTAPTTAKPTTVEKTYLYGDVDFDNAVTIIDATTIQKSLAQLVTLKGKANIAGDVDGNCTIDIIDATYIQKKLASMITKFPAGEKYYY
ncbi:MAG: starch-binding protein [Oscillospiraceae bacterium]|nr:starch-binding protein [Candidatus Ruminococcus equi]